MKLDDLIASLSQLSDDPDRAFFEYEEIKRAELEDALAIDGSGWSSERLYVDQIKVFLDVFGKNGYVSVGSVPVADNSFMTFYTALRQEIDRAKLKFTLEEAVKAKTLTDSVVILTAETKLAIRSLIEAIKLRLDEMNLTDSKRRALVNKLNSFLNELDQNHTHTEAFFSFVVQAGRAASEAGAEFKPLGDRIDRILDMIDDGKKWVESLPGFRRPKQIEGSKKQIEDHSKEPILESNNHGLVDGDKDKKSA